MANLFSVIPNHDLQKNHDLFGGSKYFSYVCSVISFLSTSKICLYLEVKSALKRTRNEQRHLPQRQYEIARNLHSLAIVNNNKERRWLFIRGI